MSSIDKYGHFQKSIHSWEPEMLLLQYRRNIETNQVYDKTPAILYFSCKIHKKLQYLLLTYYIINFKILNVIVLHSMKYFKVEKDIRS